ncbi:VanZ family protein [Clostridium thermobutyricum]
MKKNIINALFKISFTFYSLFLMGSILFKYVSPIGLFSDDRYFARSINLIPFNDVINGSYNSLDIWGNVILFIPLGIYISIFFKKSKVYKNIIKIAGISLIFELFQYILAIGASDISDIITNTFGGIIGITIYLIIKKILKQDDKVKTFISICSSVVMIPVTFILLALIIYN